MPPITGMYLTRTGICVVAYGEPREVKGRLKVACFRRSTGGWHGWLNLDGLVTVH